MQEHESFRCMYCLGRCRLDAEGRTVTCECGKQTWAKLAEILSDMAVHFGRKASAERIRRLAGIAIGAAGLRQTYNGIENVPIEAGTVAASIGSVNPEVVFGAEAIEAVGIIEATAFIESEAERLSYLLKIEVPFWVAASAAANTYEKII